MRSRILIVEDEPAILDNIQYVLESEGLETIRLSEGLPVLPLLARERVDLILLDIGLPDINGIDLCKEIRKTSSVPVIFLTARGGELDRVVGLEIGGDDYVSKPFSPRELSARVKAVLRRTKAMPGAASVTPQAATGTGAGIAAGMGGTAGTAGAAGAGPAPGASRTAFVIDESRRAISYAGRPLELSRYEYEILLVFIRRPGHVFSREEIMSLIWEQPETSLERSVDAHIKNIRAKLKAVRPDRDPIATHRGFGYSLKEDP